MMNDITEEQGHKNLQTMADDFKSGQLRAVFAIGMNDQGHLIVTTHIRRTTKEHLQRFAAELNMSFARFLIQLDKAAKEAVARRELS